MWPFTRRRNQPAPLAQLLQAEALAANPVPASASNPAQTAPLDQKPEVDNPYRWIENDGLLRDEGVYYGQANSSTDEKLKAIGHYFAMKKTKLAHNRESLTLLLEQARTQLGKAEERPDELKRLIQEQVVVAPRGRAEFFVTVTRLAIWMLLLLSATAVFAFCANLVLKNETAYAQQQALTPGALTALASTTAAPQQNQWGLAILISVLLVFLGVFLPTVRLVKPKIDTGAPDDDNLPLSALQRALTNLIVPVGGAALVVLAMFLLASHAMEGYPGVALAMCLIALGIFAIGRPLVKTKSELAAQFRIFKEDARTRMHAQAKCKEYQDELALCEGKTVKALAEVNRLQIELLALRSDAEMDAECLATQHVFESEYKLAKAHYHPEPARTFHTAA